MNRFAAYLWMIAIGGCCVAIVVAARGGPQTESNSPASVETQPDSRPASEIGNNGGGGPFRQAPGKGTVLVGCEVTLVDFGGHVIIKSVAPVFEDPNGRRFDGAVQGRPGQMSVRVEAEKGYAVAQILGISGDRVDGFYFVFMRRKGDRLDPNDRYLGRWLGAGTANTLKAIGAGDKPATGLTGRSGEDVDAVSLSFD